MGLKSKDDNLSVIIPRNSAYMKVSEKYTTSVKRTKKKYRNFNARENMQQVPRKGKHATSGKSGKTCNKFQGMENM